MADASSPTPSVVEVSVMESSVNKLCCTTSLHPLPSSINSSPQAFPKPLICSFKLSVSLTASLSGNKNAAAADLFPSNAGVDTPIASSSSSSPPAAVNLIPVSSIKLASSSRQELVYFDRVQFKGMRVNRTYPTIVGWSAELARKRVREENKAGSFGRGTVLPRISKPADIAAASSGQTDQPPIAALNIPSSSVDKVAGILQKLASTVGEFGEAMTEIGKQ
nr:uncharacterized protein LOC109158994 [Ipomoea batatas]